jgi:hypothetical protein
MRLPRVLAIAVVAALVAAGTPCLAACLSYNNRVDVTGTLLRIVFPGPPGYESVARGDAPEPYFVLRLNPPVCVDRDPAGNDNPGIARLRDMQLMLKPEQYARLRPHLGRRIHLSGALFPASTGHHHTPVMLSDIRFGTE